MRLFWGLVQAMAPNLMVGNLAKLAAGSGGTAARPFIRFSGRGSSSWQGGGTFVFCDSRGANSLTALNIVVSGDIRKARENAGAFMNVFGDTAACPSSSAPTS